MKVSVKSLLFTHFVKVAFTPFIISVVFDTASLSTGIDTDTENKENIILLFFNKLHNRKLASANFSLRKSRN